jgi:hypothetical protein
MSGSETTTHPDASEVTELDDTAPPQELVDEPPPATADEPVFAPARASTWRDGVTGQLEAVWQNLRVHDNSRHIPVHAAPQDERAERIAAAGMGLLVLVGAVVTYLAMVGAIDPLLAPAPAGGAPPAVVRSVTPSPTPTPPATEPVGVGASTEPTAPRTRSRANAPATVQQSAPTPKPTPTTPPPTTGPTPSPTPSPSG